MEINLKNIENAFFSDGYQLGMKFCMANADKGLKMKAISTMYASIDAFIENLVDFAKNQNHPPDCKKGCEWCCHQPVFALDYELGYLIRFIETNFDLKTQNRIKQQAIDKMNAFKMLNEKKLMNAKFPCPLLENGGCIAYSVRPVACRIYLSSDVKTCLRFFKKPGNKGSIPALYNLPLRAGKMMNEGFKAALKTSGIRPQEFRIEEKLIGISSEKC